MNIKKCSLVNKLKSFSIGLMLSTLTLPGVVNANVFVEDKFNIVMTPDHFPIIWKKSQQYGLDFFVSSFDMQSLELCGANSSCPQEAIDAGAVYFKEFVVDGLIVVAYYDTNGKLLGTSEGSLLVGGSSGGVYTANNVPLENTVDSNGNSVGIMTAGFEVTDNGGASYSIPVVIPPGVSGMQPELTMSYNSQVGNGIMGFGFDVNALSTISRCSISKVFVEGLNDGVGSDEVTFSASDTYCLDGQRLIPIAGENGADLTEYRTEIDGFSRIVSFGVTGTGPSYFKVWTKSGQTIEYGNSPDAFIEVKGERAKLSYTEQQKQLQGYVPPAYAWAMNKVTDASHNYMTYHYDEMQDDAIEFYLKEIKYTGNSVAGLSPFNSVKFTYNQPSTNPQTYIGGYKYKLNKYLTNIDVYSKSQKTREYKIEYSVSSRTSALLVKSIQECSGNSSQYCYKPVSFTWGTKPYSNPVFKSRLVGQFNLPDITSVLYQTGTGKRPESIRITSMLNTSKKQLALGPFPDGAIGYYDPVSNTSKKITTFDSRWAKTGLQPFTRIADFTGDGVPDYLFGPGKRPHDWLGLSLTSEYGATPDQLEIVSNNLGVLSYDYNYIHNDDTYLPQNVLTIDLDGDSLSDVLIPTAYYVHGGILKTTDRSTWNSFNVTAANTDTFSLNPITNLWGKNRFGTKFQVFDFNADGLMDVYGRRDNEIMLSRRKSLLNIAGIVPSSLNSIFNYPSPICALPEEDTCTEKTNDLTKIIDFNGDGLQDMFLASSYWNDENSLDNYLARWRVAISTGHGLVDSGVNLNHATSEYYNDQRVIPFDVNHDGKTDIIVPKYISNGILEFNYYESTGTQFILKNLSVVDTGNLINEILIPGTSEILGSSGVFGIASVDDFDGDGIQELVFLPTNNSKIIALEPDIDIQSDMVTSIQNGDGLKTKITYDLYDNLTPPVKNITCNNGPEQRGYVTDVLCGDSRYMSAPTYFVKKVEKEVDNNLPTSTTFKYSGLGVNPTRGIMGFSWMEKTDHTQGIKVTKKFHQKFPFTGMPSFIKKETIDGNLKSTVSYQYVDIPTYTNIKGGAKVHHPKLKVSHSREYDITRGSVLRTVTTESDFDNYGNTVWQRVTTSGGWGSDTYSTTTNNTFDNVVDSISINNPRWHLGRLRRSEVTAVVSSNTNDSQTRIAAFDYYTDTGLLKTEVSEPDVVNESDLSKKRETHYQYDVYGRKEIATVKGWDYLGNPLPDRKSESRLTFPYDSELGKTVGQIQNYNALTQSETIKYDLSTGQNLVQTGPNGLSTYWYYDTFGRLTKQRAPSGIESTTSYQWSSADYTHSYYSVTSSVTGQLPVTKYFDKNEREIRVKSHDAFGRVVVVDTEYNSYGSILRKSDPHYEFDTVYWTTLDYDKIGRLISSTHKGGPDATQAYQDLATTTYYDGLKTTVTNPKGQITTTYKNIMDKVVRVEQPMGAVLQYTYDANQNLTKIKDSLNQVTSFVYDVYGRKTSMTDPVMGVWDYKYNSFDELQWQQSPDQKSNLKATTIDYDVLGRMISRTEDEGTTNWVYGTVVGEIGKLIQVTSPGVSKSIMYDPLLRPKTTTQSYMGESFSTTVDYDALSRVIKEIRPDGTEIDHHYNDNGALIALTSPLTQAPDFNQSRFNAYASPELKAIAGTTNAVWWGLLDVNARNQVISQFQGNGYTTQTEFDEATGVTLSIQSGINGLGTVQNLVYGYDKLHNLALKQDLNLGVTEEAVYDDLNRVDITTVTDSSTGLSASNDYFYDVAGNITGINTNNTYHYSLVTTLKGKRLISVDGVGNYSYDLNGNITASGTADTIKYSSFNKPTSFTKGTKSTSFVYDGGHNRIQRYEVRDGKNVRTNYYGKLFEKITTTDSASVNVEHKNYIYAGNKLVAISKTRPGSSPLVQTTQYVHADMLGSTNAITDSNGNVIDRMSYDVFGKRRALDWKSGMSLAMLAALPTNRGYTGHEHIDEFELIHMNGRVYDPVIGRFLSPDPFVQSPGDMRSFNRYSYVWNNPLSNTDPSGHISLSATLNAHQGRIVQLGMTVLATMTGNPYVMATVAFATTYQQTNSTKRASVAAITALIFYELNVSTEMQSLPDVAQIAINGFVGGMTNVAAGGKFSEGFLAASFNKWVKVNDYFGMMIDGPVGIGQYIENAMVSAAVGGISADLGGGKFANGAVTGAFVRLFGDYNKYYESQTPTRPKNGWGVLYYWPPKDPNAAGTDKLYGHVSLLLEDDTYISGWPSEGIKVLYNTDVPMRNPNFTFDLYSEQLRVPISIIITGLDIAAIKDWWYGTSELPGRRYENWTLFDNCSTIVNEALQSGGYPIADHIIYHPAQVYNDVK